MLRLSADMLDRFANLSAQMSPENLTCDGELSRAAVNRRRRDLRRQWTALERQVGRRVTDDEVLLAWCARRRQASVEVG